MLGRTDDILNQQTLRYTLFSQYIH